jgi:ubiquinone/menaquinone biosynthesis C-methylase UbiE
MDGALSIAVIHHLSTFERRLSALHEMARVVRRGGRLMIYVWAYEQSSGAFTSQDVLVPWYLHEIPCKYNF